MIRVIIVGGDQPRSKNLYRDLQDSGLFKVEIQARINKSDFLKLNDAEKGSSKKYGRTLSISERSCALAHRLAQETLASTGGIILEDDAVVLDFQALANFGASVVDSKQSILLNYSTSRCAEDVSWNLTSNSIIRTIGPSPLAVGYAASRSKLSQLVKANHNLEYVADWPPTNAKHYRLKYPVVAHGLRNTTSLIEGTTNRNQKSLFELLSGAHFQASLNRVTRKFQFELTSFLLRTQGAEK